MAALSVMTLSATVPASAAPEYTTWQACAKAYGLSNKKASAACCYSYVAPLKGIRWAYSNPCARPN